MQSRSALGPRAGCTCGPWRLPAAGRGAGASGAPCAAQTLRSQLPGGVRAAAWAVPAPLWRQRRRRCRAAPGPDDSGACCGRHGRGPLVARAGEPEAASGATVHPGEQACAAEPAPAAPDGVVPAAAAESQAPPQPEHRLAWAGADLVGSRAEPLDAALAAPGAAVRESLRRIAEDEPRLLAQQHVERMAKGLVGALGGGHARERDFRGRWQGVMGVLAERARARQGGPARHGLDKWRGDLGTLWQDVRVVNHLIMDEPAGAAHVGGAPRPAARAPDAPAEALLGGAAGLPRAPTRGFGASAAAKRAAQAASERKRQRKQRAQAGGDESDGVLVPRAPDCAEGPAPSALQQACAVAEPEPGGMLPGLAELLLLEMLPPEATPADMRAVKGFEAALAAGHGGACRPDVPRTGKDRRGARALRDALVLAATAIAAQGVPPPERGSTERAADEPPPGVRASGGPAAAEDGSPAAADQAAGAAAAAAGAAGAAAGAAAEAVCAAVQAGSAEAEAAGAAADAADAADDAADAASLAASAAIHAECVEAEAAGAAADAAGAAGDAADAALQATLAAVQAGGMAAEAAGAAVEAARAGRAALPPQAAGPAGAGALPPAPVPAAGAEAAPCKAAPAAGPGPAPHGAFAEGAPPLPPPAAPAPGAAQLAAAAAADDQAALSAESRAADGRAAEAGATSVRLDATSAADAVAASLAAPLDDRAAASGAAVQATRTEAADGGAACAERSAVPAVGAGPGAPEAAPAEERGVVQLAAAPAADTSGAAAEVAAAADREGADAAAAQATAAADNDEADAAAAPAAEAGAAPWGTPLAADTGAAPPPALPAADAQAAPLHAAPPEGAGAAPPEADAGAALAQAPPAADAAAAPPHGERLVSGTGAEAAEGDGVSGDGGAGSTAAAAAAGPSGAAGEGACGAGEEGEIEPAGRGSAGGAPSPAAGGLVIASIAPRARAPGGGAAPAPRVHVQGFGSKTRGQRATDRKRRRLLQAQGRAEGGDVPGGAAGGLEGGTGAAPQQEPLPEPGGMFPGLAELLLLEAAPAEGVPEDMRPVKGFEAALASGYSLACRPGGGRNGKDRRGARALRAALARAHRAASPAAFAAAIEVLTGTGGADAAADAPPAGAGAAGASGAPADAAADAGADAAGEAALRAMQAENDADGVASAATEAAAAAPAAQTARSASAADGWLAALAAPQAATAAGVEPASLRVEPHGGGGAVAARPASAARDARRPAAGGAGAPGRRGEGAEEWYEPAGEAYDWERSLAAWTADDDPGAGAAAPVAAPGGGGGQGAGHILGVWAALRAAVAAGRRLGLPEDGALAAGLAGGAGVGRADADPAAFAPSPAPARRGPARGPQERQERTPPPLHAGEAAVKALRRRPLAAAAPGAAAAAEAAPQRTSSAAAGAGRVAVPVAGGREAAAIERGAPADAKADKRFSTYWRALRANSDASPRRTALTARRYSHGYMASHLLAPDRRDWKAAGVLVYSFSADGRLRLLLGRACRAPRGGYRYYNNDCWTILGGKRNLTDVSAEATAVREMTEETGGLLSGYHVGGQLQPVLWYPAGCYACYPHRLAGGDELPAQYQRLAARRLAMRAAAPPGFDDTQELAWVPLAEVLEGLWRLHPFLEDMLKRTRLLPWLQRRQAEHDAALVKRLAAALPQAVPGVPLAPASPRGEDAGVDGDAAATLPAAVSPARPPAPPQRAAAGKPPFGRAAAPVAGGARSRADAGDGRGALLAAAAAAGVRVAARQAGARGRVWRPEDVALAAGGASAAARQASAMLAQASVLSGACATAFLPGMQPVPAGGRGARGARAAAPAGAPAGPAAPGPAQGTTVKQAARTRPSASPALTALALGAACWDGFLPVQRAGRAAASLATPPAPAGWSVQARVAPASDGAASGSRAGDPAAAAAGATAVVGSAAAASKAGRGMGSGGLAKTLAVRKARAKHRARFRTPSKKKAAKPVNGDVEG